MADQYVISSANLNYIERSLNSIHNDLGSIDLGVNKVNDNVKIVYDSVGALANEFHSFIQMQIKANRLGQAHTKVVQIRQEIEKKYGHYDIVRRTTTGILQADDLGLVKKETISTATEELMISTPNYWLAPCLVALAAWINDQPELAERAVREAIKRNDEKTSLFFALVCRRADRRSSSLKWTQRYLANQNEENLDRKTIIILDAFASGLLGADSEGVISRQMDTWMEHLADKPGFIEQQTTQWSDAIKQKRKPFDGSDYTYLQKYSKSWPLLQDIMEGAMLHSEILNYFTNIFNQENSTATLKEQLDDILNSLVTGFDDEEIPLRKKEKFEQFVIEFEGDEERAKRNMAVEESAFETYKNFTQLLTDAAMKPESSNASVSTQKFAIALSKDWITNAYNDVTAENRMKIPQNIQINIEDFNGITCDGSNEEELVNDFNILIDNQKNAEIQKQKLSSFEQFCLVGGIIIGAMGFLVLLFQHIFFGIAGLVAGIGMVLNHFSKKKRIEANIENINKLFENKRTMGLEILRAVLAEVVDFRAEFAEKDMESKNVLDFLEQISPEQYVRKLSESGRKVIIK